MQLRKVKFLLLALAVVSGLFAGAEAGASTFDYEITSVTVFVAQDSATYAYQFSQVPGSTALSYVDFQIPEDINIRQGPYTLGATNSIDGTRFEVVLNGATPVSGEVYCLGCGDFGTKFGIGNTMYRVLKANIPSTPSTFTVSITITIPGLDTASKMFSTNTSGAILVKAGNGSNTETFIRATPAIVDKPALAPPALTSITVVPNPFTTPECAAVNVNSQGSLFTITGTGIEPVSIASGQTAYVCLSDAPRCAEPQSADTICLAGPGTFEFSVTATGTTGTSDPVRFTVTADPPPLIQTTCKQIVKRPPSGSASCIYLCLNTINGFEQDIASATWYANESCTGAGYPLDIWGEADTDEKTLICAPCRFPGVDAIDPQACTDNTDDTVTPFRMNFKGQWKNCDVFKYERQDQGFSAVLGTDPWVVINGKAVWTR